MEVVDRVIEIEDPVTEVVDRVMEVTDPVTEVVDRGRFQEIEEKVMEVIRINLRR